MEAQQGHSYCSAAGTKVSLLTGEVALTSGKVWETHSPSANLPDDIKSLVFHVKRTFPFCEKGESDLHATKSIPAMLSVSHSWACPRQNIYTPHYVPSSQPKGNLVLLIP